MTLGLQVKFNGEPAAQICSSTQAVSGATIDWLLPLLRCPLVVNESRDMAGNVLDEVGGSFDEFAQLGGSWCDGEGRHDTAGAVDPAGVLFMLLGSASLGASFGYARRISPLGIPAAALATYQMVLAAL